MSTTTFDQAVEAARRANEAGQRWREALRKAARTDVGDVLIIANQLPDLARQWTAAVAEQYRAIAEAEAPTLVVMEEAHKSRSHEEAVAKLGGSTRNTGTHTRVGGFYFNSLDASNSLRGWARDHGYDTAEMLGIEGLSLLRERSAIDFDERFALWYNCGQSDRTLRKFVREWDQASYWEREARLRKAQREAEEATDAQAQ